VQNIIIDKPYQFVPPAGGSFWPFLMRQFARIHLEKTFGIFQVRTQGLERLKTSIESGAGILLTPNHSHPADPFVLIEIGRLLGFSPYIMASWHLFMQGRMQRWILRNARVFSVYREGLDRQALTQAIEILDQGAAPLVIFPEGVISRHNDKLNPLMDGVSLIAKGATKKRAARSAARGVVVHPVALKYEFNGDVESAVAPVITRIEQRLTWEPRPDLPLKERIVQIGVALLGLKEIEYLGTAQQGTLAERIERLIDQILTPLEAEWTAGKREAGTVARVKRLRSAVLSEMVQGDMPEAERARRWNQLKAMYLAQQLHSYPPDYISGHDSANRIVETVERFEEDLTDKCTTYSPRSVKVEIGEGIETAAGDVGQKKSGGVIEQVEARLLQMLNTA
jgi:1-acyl-sn-glycerol-3-phosphate acyltransferase